MNASTFLLFNLAPYLALACLVFGLAWRLMGWLRPPLPLPITLTPAPFGRVKALLRLAGEIAHSPTLRRADLSLWLLSGLFHVCLALVLLRHLRYFLHPVPAWLLWMQTPGVIAGFLLPPALMGLFLRRLVLPGPRLLDRVRDYLPLLTLLALGSSGIWLRLGARPPLVEVKAYALSLAALAPTAPPWGLSLALHLTLAWVLLAIYPWSRLVHGLALLLNPIWGRAHAPERAPANPWDNQISDQPTLGQEPDSEGRRLWDEARYHEYLRARWSLGGVRQVMGAGERAARQGKV